MKKQGERIDNRSGELSAWRGRVARCRYRLWRGRIDAGTHKEEQVDEKDGDEDKATDEDVRAESHDGLVFGKVRRRDVVMFVVAFVVMLVHANQLTGKHGLRAI
jgi:hypothetical protein